ncbi:MAG: 2-C-methyl-D-erythritol 2,4-cyclodiphosphate synthase [Bacteroidota bacterium]
MVGFGYDVHRLAAGESLILGGIKIESEMGTVAHSDGDVLLHAVCDALLGAAGLGDIGEHFPDTDEKYKDRASTFFLEKVMSLLQQNHYKLINLDCTLVLEQPKILPYKSAIRKSIASICGLDVMRVSIKATTSEKVGFVGRGEGVEAYCICEIQPK